MLDATSSVPIEDLIDRAGRAVAREALDLLGGAYGRRVVVLVGKGHNGEDGRVAARLLARRGVRVEVVDVERCPSTLPACDLVIDAAFGTGFRGVWRAPATDAPVLAVDVPSGVDGLTGEAGEGVLPAVRTVTFAAFKQGLLFGRGAVLAGEVVVADIGLDAASVARAWVVEPADVRGRLPRRRRDDHKWRSATWIVAGSPGMTGAAELAAAAALRSGSGYVRLSVPGAGPGDIPGAPPEAVRRALPERGWATEVLDGIGRFRSIVVGPGLGRASDADVRRLVDGTTVPTVVDGDGLTALVPLDGALPSHTILTPHDGELSRLTGEPVGPDRVGDARALAGLAECTVLLKGPVTTVAGPDGTVLLTTTGDARLATAGTGDVLSGVIGGLLAQGVEPLWAAAAGAWLHGTAAGSGPARGLVAGDLPDFLPSVFDRLER